METSENQECIVALSDIGLRRKNNEDVAYAAKSEYGVLLLVADGMGGHRKGEVASALVLDSLKIPFLASRRRYSTFWAKHFFHKHLKEANKSIYKTSLSGDQYMEMGTTAVSALVAEKETVVVSVGDSRCYILNSKGELAQVTVDQSYVEMLFEAGRISKEEMATHPQKNILTNSIGINPDLNSVEEYILKNDSYKILFLCSDGLYNMVKDEEIACVLKDNTLSVAEKGKKLIDLALANGGSDNVAVAIYQKN